MRSLRGHLWRLLVDSCPLLLSYLATILGTSWIVRHSSHSMQASYLIVSVFVPQVGLYSDWGRGLTLLVRAGAQSNSLRETMVSNFRLLPLLSLPTILPLALLLVTIPLRASVGFGELLRLSVVVAITTFAIGMANFLRVALLGLEKRGAYFWSQLWVAAGIPAFIALGMNVSLGLLVATGGYCAQVAFLTREIWKGQTRSKRPRGERRRFLRGDKLAWAFGATQLLTAASVAVELPLLVAFAPNHTLPYFALSRIVQGVVSLANRPIERGLPDIVRAEATAAPAALAAWRSHLKLGIAAAVAGGLIVATAGPPLATLWLGSHASLGLVLAVLGFPLTVLAVLYRAAASEAVAAQDGPRVFRMSLFDLGTKLAFGVLLVPYYGGVGLAWAGVASMTLGFLASNRLITARRGPQIVSL